MPLPDQPEALKIALADESLTAEVSADVAPVVEAFMARSALANEAEGWAAQVGWSR